ncbi:hypothetical protein BH11VER1_BH11VER1_14940 [soil metagenome]
MRALILSLSFLPFIYFASKDHSFHFRGRKVSRTEHLLHAGIGLSLIIVFSHAVMANHWQMVGGLVFFALAGAVDEYIFHRDIPGEESDLHAKEHLALLAFIVISLTTDWLADCHWNLIEAWTRIQLVNS